MFVERDQLADRVGKPAAVRGGERIGPRQILKARDQDRKAQRIEPRVEQRQIVRKRRQRLLLLSRNLLNLAR